MYEVPKKNIQSMGVIVKISSIDIESQNLRDQIFPSELLTQVLSK